MEDEVFGTLTQEEFQKFLEVFTERFGEPSRKNRLKVSYWDPKINKNFDAQLRITNRVAEVMVKDGEWENQVVQSRKEESFEIIPTVENCMGMINAFDLMYKTTFAPNAHKYESYIWDVDGYEIKLAKQFNRENKKFLFEVELTKSGLSLEEISKDLGLRQLILETDLDFWDDWNKVVNIEFGKLSKEEQSGLVEGYL